MLDIAPASSCNAQTQHLFFNPFIISFFTPWLPTCMYTDFYQLKEKPFQISSDPSFIWLGEKHKEALATLRYSVIDNKGLMLLTGDVGTGKTTLINTLLKSLGNDVLYASVPDPRLELIDFLNYIAQAFHIDSGFESKGSFLLHFGWFLESAYKQKKKALLIVDEAQLLTQDLLEEIRLLSNINRDGNHLLNIFFVGQNEFNEILHRPENRAVTQRITLNYQIDQLSMEETALYIQHRLKVAGSRRVMFNTAALQTIHSHSEGIPRRINVICDHCLLTGYIEGKSTIDERIVEDCVKDIAIPHYKKATQPDRREDPPQAAVRKNRFLLSRWQGIALLLIAVPLLSALIAMLMSPSVDMRGKMVSTYQAAARYLSGTSLPVDSVEEPQSQTDSAGAGFQASVQQKRVVTPMPPPEEKTVTETVLKAADSIAVSDIPAGRSAAGVTESDVTSGNREKRPADEQGSAILISDIESQSAVPLRPPVKEDTALAQERPSTEQSTGIGRDSTPGVQENRVVITFERNSNDLSAPNLDQLIELGLSVKKQNNFSLIISGYTDSAGSRQYNEQLSLIRANMVKSYLLGLGIPSDRMTVRGLGSQFPVADNETEEGRQLNRRVEIEVAAP